MQWRGITCLPACQKREHIHGGKALFAAESTTRTQRARKNAHRGVRNAHDSKVRLNSARTPVIEAAEHA